ncbi:hypothetical protein Tco_0330939 [Tanacetum coccineum]
MDEGTKNYSFDHIFAGSNPSVLVDKTKSARDGIKTAHTNSGANEESRADDISVKVKLEDLSKILKDTRSAFFTPDSPPDEPIIVSDESEEEEEVAKYKDTEATSHDVAELKNIKWELPAEFLTLQSQVSLVQEKLKILDSLLSLWHKVTDTLTRFATMVKNASGEIQRMNVPLAGKKHTTVPD